MLKALLLPLSLALAATATAQNLVPNPSFEDTARCGEYDILYLQMPPWFNPNNATPDVYDNNLVSPCGNPWDPGDPDVQDQGYQYAHTGTRFAGGFHYVGPWGDSKDYLMVRLLTPLTAGSNYEASVYYSRADGYLFATDRISLYFATDSFHFEGGTTIAVTPQVDLMVEGGDYLTEADGWVLLVDTFVAQGGEEYMVIGSFQDSSEIDVLLLPPGWVDWQYAYYYYDDVSVRLVEPQGLDDLQVPPVQSGGLVQFTWRGNYDLDLLRVFDSRGCLVVEWPGSVSRNGANTVPFAVAAGSYVVQAIGQGRRSASRLIWLGSEH